MPPRQGRVLISGVQHEGFGAYLFVDDDDVVLRFALTADRVRIGRSEDNDIWVDHPAVRPHTLLVYAKDDTHCIKVYDGAKVLLNGAPVAGMHRLYSGDCIGVADREFLYGRDDTPPECALGLTVLVDGVVSHATVFRRTRVRLGRRDADIVLDDPAVGDRHLTIECYGADGLFALDHGAPTGTFLKGKRISERVRLADGASLSIGRIVLRLNVLPTDAHGLLLAELLPDQPKVPLAAPSPMDRSGGQRLDPGAQGPRRRSADPGPRSGGFVRPLNQANIASRPASLDVPRAVDAGEPPPLPGNDAVPATQIGSLAQLAELERQRLGRARVEAESSAVEPTRRPMPAEPRPPQVPPAPVVPLRTGFHEARTDVIDTEAIRQRLRPGDDWRAEAERALPQRPGEAQPLTQMLDLSPSGPADPRRPQTWTGRAEEPPPPPAARYQERPRLQKERFSESEMAANPGLARGRPDLQDPHLDGPVRDRRTDASRRPSVSRVVDGSRRLPDDDP